MSSVAEQQGQSKDCNGGKESGGGKRLGRAFAVGKSPLFLTTRRDAFDALLAKHQSKQEAREKANIEVRLPDGKVVGGTANVTSPFDIAMTISKGLALKAIVAKVAYDDSTHVTENVAAADHDEDDEPSDSCCGKSHEQWQLWDMKRPLEGSCRIELKKFEDEEGRHVFWHSAAHVLGQALEQEFGAHLTIGPALRRGFYYDCYVGTHNFNFDIYPLLDKHAERIAKEDQKFERVVISKGEALELFADNPFKAALIRSKIPDGGHTTCYRCGSLVDLCRGPHVPSTSYIKAFAIEKHSSAYWLGDPQNDSLQRVYGIAFPEQKELKEHKRMMEEAKKRDHRLLGNSLQLYFFDTNLSPGSAFWLPDGAKIYNKLIELVRREYRIRSFDEVISPNIYSSELFKISGHLQNYKENMYMFDVEGAQWGLKPMNCPGHCLIFRHMNPSYRQLPIRMADFGVLHRNELSGSLSGLTRVRRFQQDDGHVFMRMDQVKQEVSMALDFLFYVYGLLGFTFQLNLATRPKKAMGDIELWRVAERNLAETLDECGHPWKFNEGDGAFYGPKIDVRLQDAIKRWHQCGTIQLDFQMPLRFNLQYRTDEVVTTGTAGPSESQQQDQSCTAATGATAPTAPTAPTPTAATATDTAATATAVVGGAAKTEGEKSHSLEQNLKKGYGRPVMVHRAILGSVERMCAVIVEHTAGKFPFWLSPRQAVVCPISEATNHYGAWVRKTLHDHGYDVALDDSNRTINKKIREAQIGQWNFILVVGAKEESDLSVTVRIREDPKNQSQLSIGQLIEKFAALNFPSSKPLFEVSQYVPQSAASPAAADPVGEGSPSS